MKIFVQLEADTAEELQAFFATFHGKQFPSIGEQHTFAKAETVRVDEAVREPEIKAGTTLVQDVMPEPVVVEPEAPPVEKPRRGRKPKAQPVDKAPVVAQPTEPVIKPPVGPAPQIELPKQAETATRQDLLNVFSEYVQRYGVSFGYTDISSLLQQHVGDGIRKASDVPDEALSTAITAISAAINDNPFNRKRDYA